MVKGKPLSTVVVRQSIVLGQWYVCRLRKSDPNIAVNKVEIPDNVLDSIMISRLKKEYETNKDSDMMIPMDNGKVLRVHLELESVENDVKKD